MGTNVNVDGIAEISGLQGRTSPLERRPLAESPISGARPESSDFDLRTVICGFNELPELVRHYNFTRVDERRLDYELMTTLLTQLPPPNYQHDWEQRLQRRKDALVRHQGKILHCVFIGLPGVHYTIEVDLEARAVVHWEWQNT